MFATVAKKMFGTANERLLKSLDPIVQEINKKEDAIKKLSDKALKGKTEEFKSKLKKGATLEDILPEAFAVYSHHQAECQFVRAEVHTRRDSQGNIRPHSHGILGQVAEKNVALITQFRRFFGEK